MTIYVAQWRKVGDGFYTPDSQVRVESISKESAYKKAKRLIEEYQTLTRDVEIFTIKEYGELMAEKLGRVW